MELLLERLTVLEKINKETKIEWRTMREGGWTLIENETGETAWARVEITIVPIASPCNMFGQDRIGLYLCGGDPHKSGGLRHCTQMLTGGSVDVFVVDAAYNFNLLSDTFFTNL